MALLKQEGDELVLKLPHKRFHFILKQIQLRKLDAVKLRI